MTDAVAAPLVVGLAAGRLAAALVGFAGVEESFTAGFAAVTAGFGVLGVGVAARGVRGVGAGLGVAGALVAEVNGVLLAAVAEVAREAPVAGAVAAAVVVVFLTGATAGFGAEAGRAVVVLGAGVGRAAGTAVVVAAAGAAFLNGDSLVGRAGLAAADASAGAFGSAAGRLQINIIITFCMRL